MWPIFIINLDRAQGRMTASEAMMRNAGLDFERVSACDWQRLDQKDLDEYTSSQPPLFAKRPMTPVEIACFISHRELWREIAAGEAPGAFIFEDDFEIEPSLKGLLGEISSDEPDWDILKLYSNKKKDLSDSTPLTGEYRIGTPKVIPMSTIAYAITRPAAANLLKMSIPFRRPVDLYLKHWWEHGACVKLVMPSPVDRRHDHLVSSEIDPSRKTLSAVEPLSRFIKNALYQLAFKARTNLIEPRRPMHRRWFDDQRRPDDRPGSS